MLIEVYNYITKRTNAMDLPITSEQLARWKGGELIQNVMGHLTADQREFLISGMMPDEWDSLFGDNV